MGLIVLPVAALFLAWSRIWLPSARSGAGRSAWAAPQIATEVGPPWDSVRPELFDEEEGPRPDILFQLDPGPGFSIRAMRSGAPVRGLLLHANMTGPRDERAGCLVSETAEPGTYSCAEASRLESGRWSATVWLLRENRVGIPNCVPLARGPDGQKRPTIKLIDYLDEVNLHHATSLDPPELCFEFPRSIAVEGTWTQAGDSMLQSTLPLCGPFEGPGRWKPIELLPSYARNPPPDPKIADSPKNAAVEPPLAHLFLPFDCHYKVWSRDEATKMFDRHRLLIVGDSRTRQLEETIKQWLGVFDPAQIKLGDRFAMAGIVTDGRVMDVVSALKQGRTVILASLLHDLGDFAPQAPVKLLRLYGPPGTCPVCENATAAECPSCMKKTYQLRTYFRNLRRFRERIEEGGPYPESGKLFFINFGVCPPFIPKKDQKQHRSFDIMEAAQDEAARILDGVADVGCGGKNPSTRKLIARRKLDRAAHRSAVSCPVNGCPLVQGYLPL